MISQSQVIESYIYEERNKVNWYESKLVDTSPNKGQGNLVGNYNFTDYVKNSWIS